MTIHSRMSSGKSGLHALLPGKLDATERSAQAFKRKTSIICQSELRAFALFQTSKQTGLYQSRDVWLFRYFHWFLRKSIVKLDNLFFFDDRHALGRYRAPQNIIFVMWVPCIKKKMMMMMMMMIIIIIVIAYAGDQWNTT